MACLSMCCSRVAAWPSHSVREKIPRHQHVVTRQQNYRCFSCCLPDGAPSRSGMQYCTTTSKHCLGGPGLASQSLCDLDKMGQSSRPACRGRSSCGSAPHHARGAQAAPHGGLGGPGAASAPANRRCCHCARLCHGLGPRHWLCQSAGMRCSKLLCNMSHRGL